MCYVRNLLKKHFIFSRFFKEESEISIQKDFGHVSYTQIAEGAKKWFIIDIREKISLKAERLKGVILFWTLQ